MVVLEYKHLFLKVRCWRTMNDSYYANVESENHVTIEVPMWMLKQMRGQARWDMKKARTKGGREDAKRMFKLLDFYWEISKDD